MGVTIASLRREAVYAAGALARMVYEWLPDGPRRWMGYRVRGRQGAWAAPGDLPPPAAMGGRHGRVLVIDAEVPLLGQDAASLATVELLRAVKALGYRPVFAAVEGAPYLAGMSERLRREGVETIEPPAEPSLERYVERERETIAGGILIRHGVARRWLPRLRRLVPGRPILFLDADLHHLRERRRAELEGSPVLRWQAGRTKQQELDVLASVDASLVHSREEADLVLRALPQAKVAVWVWPVEPRPTSAAFETRRGLLFLGGFRHHPNIDGAAWLIKDILPKVDLPDLPLRLVGSNAGRAGAALTGPGVVLVGQVDDLAPEFSRARVFVAPLRYGAGLKGKVLEAAAFGLPMVLTSVAAEGTGFEPERHALFADDADAFARAIRRLHEDQALWTSLRTEALALVERRYARDAQIKALGRLFDQLDLPTN